MTVLAPQHPSLVIDLCRVLVEATVRARSAYWTSVFGVQEALAVSLDEVNIAVAYAIAAGLVCADGAPALSLTATYEGIELAMAGQ
jgi:hypothetical protein